MKQLLKAVSFLLSLIFIIMVVPITSFAVSCYGVDFFYANGTSVMANMVLSETIPTNRILFQVATNSSGANATSYSVTQCTLSGHSNRYFAHINNLKDLGKGSSDASSSEGYLYYRILVDNNQLFGWTNGAEDDGNRPSSSFKELYLFKYAWKELHWPSRGGYPIATEYINNKTTVDFGYIQDRMGRVVGASNQYNTQTTVQGAGVAEAYDSNLLRIVYWPAGHESEAIGSNLAVNIRSGDYHAIRTVEAIPGYENCAYEALLYYVPENNFRAEWPADQASTARKLRSEGWRYLVTGNGADNWRSRDFLFYIGYDYTVSYNANGGSGAPGQQTFNYGSVLAGGSGATISSTAPTRTATVTYMSDASTNYRTETKNFTFNGWNTNSSGTGSNYSAGASYSSAANLNLFAKWTNPTIDSFPANPTPPANKYFKGWATTSGASEPNVSLGTTVTGDVTYYAVYGDINTVSYNLNGGIGTSTSQSVQDNQSVSLHGTPTKSYTVSYYLDGSTPYTISDINQTTTVNCTFNGWNSSSNDTTYSAGDSYPGNAGGTTMTAQWINTTLSTLPEAPEKDGCYFEGWYNAVEGGTPYTDSSTVSANTTLYAHWTKKISSAAVTVRDDLNWDFRCTLRGDDVGAKLYVSHEGGTPVEVNYVELSDGSFQYLFKGVSVLFMNDDFTFTLKKGDRVVASLADYGFTDSKYNFKDYCQNLHADNPTNTNLNNVLADLLNYGASAQQYKGYPTKNPTNLPNTASWVSDCMTKTADFPDPTSKAVSKQLAAKDPDNKITSVRLALNYTCFLDFFIKLSDTTGKTVKLYNEDTKTYVINGGSYTGGKIEDTNQTGVYRVLWPVSATEYDTVFRLELWDGNGTEKIHQVRYNVAAYVKSKMGTSDSPAEGSLEDLVRKLYTCGKSAKAYAGKA